MPNWCENSVKLTHQDQEMIKRLEDAFNQNRFFEEFVPTQSDLNYPEGFLEDNSQEAKERWEEQKKANLKKYGYEDWYNFHTTEWGTKWDVGSTGNYGGSISVEGNEVYLRFNTAWSPPIPFYWKLLELGFQIEAYYYGEGNRFAGKWFNGKSTGYEITNFKSVPMEFVDEFRIISEDFNEEDDGSTHKPVVVKETEPDYEKEVERFAAALKEKDLKELPSFALMRFLSFNNKREELERVKQILMKS